jgi:Domain of unknown function (DUF4337)
MGEIDEKIQEAVAQAQDSHSRLNSIVAALVALVATAMAVFNIKDGNIVQAMAQAQASSIDTWSFYQAKSSKQHMAESMVDQLTIQRELGGALTPAAHELLDRKIAEYQAAAQRYDKEKETIKTQAEDYQKEYDRLNIHDDQFDMAEAAMSVAIALAGVTALTRKRWLLVLALLFAVFGSVLGVAGFLGWSLHPAALARLLG